jgi:hypothetical protein
MLNMLRSVHECGDLFGEAEAKEAMSLALDQSYLRVVKFTETYKRLSEEAMQWSARQETTLQADHY